jgi:hypothetical protein
MAELIHIAQEPKHDKQLTKTSASFKAHNTIKG